MDTTQPVTAQLREKVYNDLWEATLHAMDKEELSEEDANDVLKLVDNLEQDEDVQKVYHNLK